MIDAGHGGADPGAAGFGLKEKGDVLHMAIAVRDRLFALGQQS